MTITAVPAVSPVALQRFVILLLATGTKIEQRTICNTAVKYLSCEHGAFFVRVLHVHQWLSQCECLAVTVRSKFIDSPVALA